ncbi:ABC transporter permease, partial [Cronobacter muytjensii]
MDTPLPLLTRLWNQAWARKTLLVVVLLALWEGVARVQNKDLMLPGFVQTLRAFSEDMHSGELPDKVVNSLGTLLKGYALGSILALLFSALAISTRPGRDLLSTLTAMFNP